MSPGPSLAAHVAGLVAAEGCLVHSGRRFALRIALSEADRVSCELARAFFGAGSLRTYPPRRDGLKGVVVFDIQSISILQTLVVPFLDEHLPASRKRTQFVEWRAALDEVARQGAPASQSRRGTPDQTRSRSS